MKINFLASNNFKTSYTDLNKSCTIDSLKNRFYREHSDKLPSPSTVYIENEERDCEEEEEEDKDVEIKESQDEDTVAAIGVDKVEETTTTTITKNKHVNIYKKAHSSIIHPHQIRFIFSGKQLENFTTIADNNIADENTILVVVSPFIMNIEKQFVKYLKMQDEKDQQTRQTSGDGENEQETSDTVFLGTGDGCYGATDKINFKLSINDRSFKSIRNQPTPDPLDKLSDQDTFALLNRIDSIDDDKLSNKPNVGATKPNVPLIPLNLNMVIKNEVSNSKLATDLDRLTLLDKPILQQPSIFEIDDGNDQVEDKMVTDSITAAAATSTKTTTTSTTTSSFEVNTITIIKPLLKIISCTPIGEVSFTKAVTVMFNRPFLPLTNDQKDYDIPIIVEPPIKDAKWRSTDGIVFKYQVSEPPSIDNGTINNSLKSCFTLSTNYRVMVDSKQFEKLYNEDIDEQTFTFSTSSQNLKYWEFNNSLDNPQIKIQFTQPIKYRTKTNSSNPERSFQIALYEKNVNGGFAADTLLRQLQFSIIDVKNETCHWKNRDSPVSDNADKTVYLKINTSLVGKFSKIIKCLITMADIGSTEGPNFNNSHVLQVQFDTVQLLTIQPELLNANTLENASHVSFISNNSLNSKLLNTVNSKEISKFISITPKVSISRLSCYGKQLTIHGQFKHSTIYYVNLVAIPDNNNQVTNGYGVFSFPDVPIKIWAQAPLYEGSSDQFYNLNSDQPPIFKINSKGTKNLIVRAHTVNEITLEKSSKISGSMKFNVTVNPNEETSTNSIDLSSFFGGRNPQSCKHNLLLFTVYPNTQSKFGLFSASIEQIDKIVEKQFLLQYTNLNISTVQLGSQSIFNITDTLTKEYLKDVSISLYNRSNPTDKTGYKAFNVRNGIQVIEKQQSECSHLIATVKQPNSNKEIKCLYQIEQTKKKEKQYKLEWVMMSDQGVCRPGDTVNVKGMIRVISDDGVVVPNEKFFDTVLDLYEPSEIKEISYSLVDGNKKPVTEGKVNLDEYGCFTISMELTLNMNLGTTNLSCTYQKETHSFTGISVEEFKRKSFLVHHQLYSSSQQGDSYEMDTPFSIELFAKSYTDEIIQNTIVDWSITVNAQPSTTYGLSREYNFRSPNSDSMYSNFNTFKYSSKRNSTGRHNLDMILQDCKYRCHLRISATVSDESNNQQEFSKEVFIENNQPRFFGILKDSAITHLINVDQDLIIGMLVCDYKSKPCDDGKIQVVLEKIPYEEDLPKQRVLTSTIIPQQLTDGNLKFSYQFKQTGYYSLKLTYVNEHQLPLSHDLSIFVMGQQTPYELEYKEEAAPIKQVKSKQTNTFNVKPKVNITCSLDKEIYSVGDTVRAGIVSKIQIGKGYLAVCKKNTIVDLFPIIVKDGQVDYSFKLLEKHSFHPTLVVYLEGTILVGIANGGYGDEDSYQKVSRITSSFVKVPLKIDYGSKNLIVSIDKLNKFQTPSKDQSITISVKDHLNEKLISNAQVTCMIVDQSVLDCTSHTVKDNWTPYDSFYGHYSDGRTKFDSILDKTIYNDPEDIQPMILDDDEDDEDNEELREIKIKYLGGRIIVLKVNSETTMDQVSAMITERDGLPKLSQRLFYLNKQIGQESTIKLKDLSIKNGSTLNLVIRLHGGSLTPTTTASTTDKPDPAVVVAQKIFLRSNFKAVALFNTLTTNENGQVTFNYKLPDNLSTFRVMVIVNDKRDCFGTAEECFTSTLPVLVRHSAPRFLNHNDQTIFPVTISSIVNFDVMFEAAIRSNNCKIEQQGFRGIIPAKSRIQVPIMVDAIVSNVSSEFQFVVKTQTMDLQQEICDAVAFKIPIHSSTVLESTTISHSLVSKSSKSEYSSHPLKFDNWRLLDTEIGGLSINFSSNRLEKVSVPVSDLFHYKYSCSEQLSSKLMGIFVYEKNPASASEEDLKKIDVSKIDQDKKNMVAMLKKRQTKNHSFTYFDGSESGIYEFVSLYVYFVLHSISEISEEAKTLSKDFEAYSKSDTNVYIWNETEYKKGKFQYLLLKSFACFVYGTVLGKSPSTEFVCKVLNTAKQNLSDTQYFEIFVHLGQFVQTHPDFKKLFNYVSINGDGGAYVDTSSAIDGFSCSNRIQSMLILLLLQCKSTPVNDAMTEKLVVGSSHFLCNGRYSNTLENSFNLYSLYKYETKSHDIEQLESPTTIANIVLNNHYVGSKDITFDKSKNYSIEIPFSQVLKNQSSIIIEKKSNSNLYYTLNLSYGSLNPFCKAVTDRGFVVSREFVPISKSSDVLIHKDIEYGNGDVNIEIKSGSRIKVVLKIQVQSVSSFIVIKDCLPAGLEPLLAESSKIYNGHWTKHVNVRENGVEIFSNLLYPGTYQYSYIVLATTRGKYISPSATAGLMYYPSSFGRTKSDLVLIK